MNIQISYRRKRHSFPVTLYAEQRFENMMDKFQKNPCHINVAIDWTDQITAVDARIKSGGIYIATTKNSSYNPFDAIDKAAKRLEAQMRKHKTKNQSKRMKSYNKINDESYRNATEVDAQEYITLLEAEAFLQKQNSYYAKGNTPLF